MNRLVVKYIKKGVYQEDIFYNMYSIVIDDGIVEIINEDEGYTVISEADILGMKIEMNY